MERMPDIPKLEYKPPSVWGGVEEIPLFVYMGIGVFLALFTSEQVLTNSPTLCAFADWMASIVPSIGPISRISSFPEVTKFFFSVMWFLSPVVVVFYMRNKVIQPWMNGIVPRIKCSSFRQFLILLTGIPIATFIGFKILTYTGFSTNDITYSGGRGRAALTMMLTNRLGFALLGTLFTVISTLCFYIPVATILIGILRVLSLLKLWRNR